MVVNPALAASVQGNGVSRRPDIVDCQNYSAMINEAQKRADQDAQAQCHEWPAERQSQFEMSCHTHRGMYGRPDYTLLNASALYQCGTDEMLPFANNSPVCKGICQNDPDIKKCLDECTW